MKMKRLPVPQNFNLTRLQRFEADLAREKADLITPDTDRYLHCVITYIHACNVYFIVLVHPQKEGKNNSEQRPADACRDGKKRSARVT